LTCVLCFFLLAAKERPEGNVCTEGEKYALIIGIDQYETPAGYKPTVAAGRIDFPNLEGCVNDAQSIQSVIASRFRFRELNINTLFNRDASRENILKAIDDLLDKCKEGDIAFIYYAGHGSQVYNSLSEEWDKKDETIVPADTWKEGVEDIRDKELSRKFNLFLDKGVRLTVILDCCHSASMSRGGPVAHTGRLRFMTPKDKSVYDAKDGSNPVPPEKRGGSSFLLISAAQDNEFAEEQVDDNSPPQVHGAFTLALLQALQQQTTDAAVVNLFSTTRAILKSNGKKQEPVMAGTAGRQQQTLFGIEKGSMPDKSLVAVAGLTNNGVLLQGGFALGIYKDNELIKVHGKDTVLLVVDTVLGINRALSSVKKGDIHTIQPGELFEISNWASPGAPLLKLYIPPGNFSEVKISQLARLDQQLKISKKVNWVNHLEKTDPYTCIFFDDGKCFIHLDSMANLELKDYSIENILSICKKDSSVFFELPFSSAFSNSLLSAFKRNKSIVIVHDASEANYTVCGTIDENGLPAYGLRRLQTSAKDSLELMPVQTKFFPLYKNNAPANDPVADSLYEYAMRLAKIRGWLQLAGPQGSAAHFPYQLEVYDADINKPITSGSYRIHDNIALHIVAGPELRDYLSGPRYIYIFGIDRSGSMQLIYPEESDGNGLNRFPRMKGNEMEMDINITSYAVPEPSGTDSFFLLTTNDPIPNYSLIFNQPGVRSPVQKSPMGDLLGLGNIESRGLPHTLPENWSIQKLSFRCTH
jgi:Caspase domain